MKKKYKRLQIQRHHMRMSDPIVSRRPRRAPATP